MYDDAMDGVVEKLLSKSAKSGYAFVGDWDSHTDHVTRKMDHLVCFLPGLLALGSVTDPRGADSDRAVRDMALAKSIMFTCYQMYHSTKSGISPEYMVFPDRDRDMDVPEQAPFYILRPEVAESLFVMAQLTNETIYREWAWEIWQAIDRHCHVDNGYASLKDVRNPKSGVDDRMESFFLAETIKYLYLAQDIENLLVDLRVSVLNTEAHPIRIFDSTRHRGVTENYS